MNVLIVNTPLFKKISHSYDEDSLPPFGLGYIATHLQKNGISVELVDAMRQRLSIEELLVEIEKSRPEYLALNIFTTNYVLVKELVETLCLNTHIVIGGLATKSLYSDIVSWNTKNNIDVVIGDGELITYDIVKNNVQEKSIIDSTFQNRRVFKVSSESVYYIKDISTIPLNRRLFDNEPTINIFGDLEVNLITSRGCIYDCSFCAAARSLNKEYGIRERNISAIEDEIQTLIDLYPKVTSIRILDDLFLKSRLTIEKAIKVFSKYNLSWRSMAHVRTFANIKQYLLEQLKNSGCKELFIGIESGSPKILEAINKTSDIRLIKSALTKLFKAGINIKGYFIYGLPGETESDAAMTYNLSKELLAISEFYGTLFRTSVFQFRPYHGTRCFEELAQEFPYLNSEQVSQNKVLSKIIGREQFNFHSKNFSNLSLDVIHDYICKTNMIQWHKNPR